MRKTPESSVDPLGALTAIHLSVIVPLINVLLRVHRLLCKVMQHLCYCAGQLLDMPCGSGGS